MQKKENNSDEKKINQIKHRKIKDKRGNYYKFVNLNIFKCNILLHLSVNLQRK